LRCRAALPSAVIRESRAVRIMPMTPELRPIL
jgi:hypothetical protein